LLACVTAILKNFYEKKQFEQKICHLQIMHFTNLIELLSARAVLIGTEDSKEKEKPKKKKDYTAKMYPFGLSYDDVLSLVITLIMTAITLGLLWWFMEKQSELGVALSAGAIGGFLHEFVQSKGKILFIQQKEDGLYLGSISGLILGMIAGLLTYGGLTGVLTDATNVTFSSFSNVQASAQPPHLEYLVFQSLIAGLALKGVSEAATSPAKSEDSFDIIAVDFTGDEKKGKIAIHLKNNLSSRLHLQLVKIIDPDKRAFVHDVSMKVDGKDTGIISFDYQWARHQTYKITVISLNGQSPADQEGDEFTSP
jgi:hypothetical protein